MDKDLDITQLDFDQLDLVACYTGNNPTNKSMTAIGRPKFLVPYYNLKIMYIE